MSFNRYSGYTITLDGNVVLKQVSACSIRSGTQKTEIQPAGLINRSFIATAAADAVVDFSSQDLATCLALNSGGFIINGLYCDTASKFQFQKRSEGTGTFSGTSVEVSALAGLAIPTRLSVSNTGPASLDMQFIPVSVEDGTEPAGLTVPGLARPLKFNASAGLAAAPMFNSLFYLGPVLGTDGNEHPGIQSVSIDFGLKISTARNYGPFPCSVVIEGRAPTLSLTWNTVYPLSASGMGLFGDAVAGSGIAVLLQKGDNGGTRVAADSGGHISLVAETGQITAESVGWQENGDGTCTMTVHPTGTITGTIGTAF